jgi:hypothetical protein
MRRRLATVRYHTENRGHRAATSSNQRASSERVEPFRGTSSVIHPPGRPPGLLVAAPEVVRDADQPPGYRTVMVLSAGASLGGGSVVIAVPTPTHRSTPPSALPHQAITVDSLSTIVVFSDCLSVSSCSYCSGVGVTLH